VSPAAEPARRTAPGLARPIAPPLQARPGPPIRTAFVLPSFAGGGAERVMLMLLDHLERSRIAPFLIVLDGAGPLRSRLPAALERVDLGTPRLRHALPRLIAALRRARPQAIVSTLGYLNIALLAARPLLNGRPALLVREANGPAASIAASACPALMRLAYRRLYPRAAAVLCNAGRTANELAALVPLCAERLVLLPNPIDVEALRVAAAEPLRVPGAGPRFVAAGRLTRQKGFDRLLEWFAPLPDDCHLTILGDGPERAALEACRAALGLTARVDIAGFVAEPAPHLAGADAFLMPSRWEGQSNAALEALALGVPVIATPEAGGIAELAASAPAGAVTIAACGAAYTAALRAVRVVPALSLRPALLPPGHEPDAVAARLAQLIEAAVA
jgi:glycosyltransferase involved in cell wall biosynthesis